MVIATIVFVLTAINSSLAVASNSGATKELKIGILAWFGWPNGVDMVRAIELMAEMDNKNGGLAIGNDRYNIKIIKYDSNAQQSTAVSVVNRLVYEDKVKFIITDGFFTSAVLPVSDPKKVILAGWAPDYPVALDPKYKYHFDACAFDGIQVALAQRKKRNQPGSGNHFQTFPHLKSKAYAVRRAVKRW